MADAVKAARRPATTTADDTLKAKSRDANVVLGVDLVVKVLRNEGVDTIFTLRGGHIIDIYDGCVNEDIKIVDVRHEQVAANAADAYARQTGRLGCVGTTSGRSPLASNYCLLFTAIKKLQVHGEHLRSVHPPGSRLIPKALTAT